LSKSTMEWCQSSRSACVAARPFSTAATSTGEVGGAGTAGAAAGAAGAGVAAGPPAVLAAVGAAVSA
jgi:hypothetical protein